MDIKLVELQQPLIIDPFLMKLTQFEKNGSMGNQKLNRKKSNFIFFENQKNHNDRYKSLHYVHRLLSRSEKTGKKFTAVFLLVKGD